MSLCGFVVEPYDENKYADTLVFIASMSAEEQEAIRRNALKKRSKYTPDKIAEKWRKIFDNL